MELTLVQKIAAASAQVGGKLKADKRNQQDGYNYVSADKILSECGQALSDQGIAIIPSIVERNVEVFDRGNGKFRYDCTLDMSFRVTDGITEIVSPWFGMGSDYTVPDKAMYKAITSGHKYFIAKLFCIGEGNEDGEHEEADDKPATKPAQKPNMTPSPANAIDTSKVKPIKPLAPILDADPTEQAAQEVSEWAKTAPDATPAHVVYTFKKGDDAVLGGAKGRAYPKEWTRIMMMNSQRLGIAENHLANIIWDENIPQETSAEMVLATVEKHLAEKQPA